MKHNPFRYESGRDLVVETSDRLRLARLRAGLEQEEMAEILGVSASTVSNWETGRTKPKLPFLAAWAQITGFNMSSLIPKDEKVNWLPRMDSNHQPPDCLVEHLCEQVKPPNMTPATQPKKVSWKPKPDCRTVNNATQMHPLTAPRKPGHA